MRTISTKKSNRLYGILTLICMVLAIASTAFILFNGSQQASRSNARSDVVIHQVQTVIHSEDTPSTRYTLSQIVRKSAHILEYGLLGLFAGLTVFFFAIWRGRVHFAAVLSVILAVATADEFIQSFVNRSSNVRDIVLDTCGGIVGLLTAALIYGLILLAVRRSEKKAKGNVHG